MEIITRRLLKQLNMQGCQQQVIKKREFFNVLKISGSLRTPPYSVSDYLLGFRRIADVEYENMRGVYMGCRLTPEMSVTPSWMSW